MEIIVLSNGKRVANFSSPHPFTFEDGTVLPAVSPEESLRLKINVIEEELPFIAGDLILTFELSRDVKTRMEEWLLAWVDGKVDVVYCPLMMLQAIAAESGVEKLRGMPFRAVRIKDRIKKLVSITEQTVL